MALIGCQQKSCPCPVRDNRTDEWLKTDAGNPSSFFTQPLPTRSSPLRDYWCARFQLASYAGQFAAAHRLDNRRKTVNRTFRSANLPHWTFQSGMAQHHLRFHVDPQMQLLTAFLLYSQQK
ncbi:unnamed protein product [Mortierella alpina]